ncbi:MAG: class I SAM-dependent methyltransferase [Candidatus Omnitrophica bacterium]|nr:class I SAM-dependent methyltransferase [Candidatus Omnitrophota bacterium]
MKILRIKPPEWEKRTHEQLRQHYEVEKELSNRLRNAHKEERIELYNVLYDELFHRVPGHSLLARKHSHEARNAAVRRQMRLLKRFLYPEAVFLEIGAGDCSLSSEVSRYVKNVYAVDVSEVITKNSDFSKKLKVIISDGCHIPIESESINIAYSYQLMEHLHPEDAFEQLREIYRTLSRGGKYICITPSRLSGPHDISKYFDNSATGFHLKEYSVKELSQLFKEAGFSKVTIYIGGKGVYMRCPAYLVGWLENGLDLLPPKLKVDIANTAPFKAFLGIRVVAEK